ncbi:MAG TPA: serine protease [Planctomycetaceae bacterium]|nr:serine protease [Planctomycetaceae bacterium]
MSVVVETLLLAVTKVNTVNDAGEVMTNATGFFYERDSELFLITNRHVVLSEENQHRPACLQIELHIDPDNIAAIQNFSIPLYKDGQPEWRETTDSAGLIDIVAIALDRSALPDTMVYEAFTPAHEVQPYDRIEVGTSLLIVGFPLGFHDSLHHLPVARQAIVASAFGMRFQGNGYFLTDARLHRGTSGAPVVAAISPSLKKVGNLPWMLLGVHAARLDVGADLTQDERLGLNCAWYADAIATLTAPAVAAVEAPAEPAPIITVPTPPALTTPAPTSPITGAVAKSKS